MPAKRPLHEPTAYEMRKQVIDADAAKGTFERQFAKSAFEAGLPRWKEPGGKVALTRSDVDLIVEKGHAELASSCLAYLLSIESGHERLQQGGFLTLIRRIRDAAKIITLAADELTDQMARHQRETGYYEQLRGRALLHMGIALHERWAHVVGRGEFLERTAPAPITHRRADGRWQHGLSCASLYKEADQFLKNYEMINEELKRDGLSVMASGNRANHERDAFVRDLAAIYERVLIRKPSARPAASGEPSPFMRFINKVFAEFPAVDDIDPKRYLPPSSGTVRTILSSRNA